MFVAVNTLIDYSENIAAYENEKCNQQKYSHKYRCTFEEFTSDDLAKQIDGFLMNSEVGMGFEIGESIKSWKLSKWTLVLAILSIRRDSHYVWF